MSLTEYCCQVPNCKEPVYCGWKDATSEKGLQTCQIHLRKHYDKTDTFSFYSLLKIPVPWQTRKERDPMAKKKTKTKSGKAVGERILVVLGVQAMKTRQIEAALNKGKAPTQRVSIHAVRAALKSLIASKQLVVVEVVAKQFVVAKAGSKAAKAKTKKLSKKSSKKKSKKKRK